MSHTFPFYKQLDQMDCGPTCLRIVAKHFGKTYSIQFLREQAVITNQGVSFAGLSKAAEHIGLRTLAANLNFETLSKQAPLPCIAHWRQKHFIVIYKVTKKKVYVSDPAFGLIQYSREEFLDGWIPKGTQNIKGEGVVLLLEPSASFHEKTGFSKQKKLGFSFLKNYFLPYKKIVFQVFFSLLVTSVLQFTFPFLTQSLVDYGIHYQNYNFIYLILGAQIAFFISKVGLQMFRDWLMLHISSRININLLSDFLMKLMNLPLSFFEKKNTGDILQRIQDHKRIQNFLSTSSFSALFSFLNIAVFCLILGYYNTTTLFIFLIGTLFYFTWSSLFLSRRKKLDYKHFDISSANQSNTLQLLNGIQEIKLNGSEHRRRWEWENIQIQLYKISTKSLALHQIQLNGSAFINELKNILITFWAASLVIKGSITLGEMLAIQYILGQLNLPVNNLMNFIQSTQDAKIGLERISDVHLSNEEEQETPYSFNQLPPKKSIAFENVSFTYDPQLSTPTLDKLSFSIPEGKTTAVVGTSGSGKTTLLKLLLKVISPSQGKIKVSETRLNEIGTSFWRSKCGAVMQDGYIFADTILKNITESDGNRTFNKQKLLNAIQIANLNDLIEKLPSGLYTKIGSGGIKLSGGQQQRILIARAIYKDPEYLFFDEATSALDAINEQEIMGKLHDFFEQKTVVIVAHRLSTVKKADNIIVLHNGHIIEQGNHHQLVSRKGAYFNLVKQQLELGN